MRELILNFSHSFFLFFSVGLFCICISTSALMVFFHSLLSSFFFVRLYIIFCPVVCCIYASLPTLFFNSLRPSFSFSVGLYSCRFLYHVFSLYLVPLCWHFFIASVVFFLFICQSLFLLFSVLCCSFVYAPLHSHLLRLIVCKAFITLVDLFIIRLLRIFDIVRGLLCITHMQAGAYTL